MLTSYTFRPKTSIYSRKATIDFTFISINYKVFFIAASYIFATSFYYRFYLRSAYLIINVVDFYLY